MLRQGRENSVRPRPRKNCFKKRVEPLKGSPLWKVAKSAGKRRGHAFYAGGLTPAGERASSKKEKGCLWRGRKKFSPSDLLTCHEKRGGNGGKKKVPMFTYREKGKSASCSRERERKGSRDSLRRLLIFFEFDSLVGRRGNVGSPRKKFPPGVVCFGRK